MKRRTWLALTAVTAASFAAGTGIAFAATAKPIKLHCKMSLSTVPPSGSNAVAQPAPNGSQFGPINCLPLGPTGFGSGVVADKFIVPDSGDTVGKYTQYFKTGTVKGSFDLTPQEQNFTQITPTTFTEQSWQGTVKVISGTGPYKGIKEKKIGTMTCKSADSVHLSCVEKITLKTL